MSSAPDWGIGEYEMFAPALVPAAEHLLRVAAPHSGERAIDLGCGSGNVTLPLAAAGPVVTAVDPSLRLLGVASDKLRTAGYDVHPVQAGAESLPLPDGDADLIVSNFGLIFCTEPEAAFAELARVLAPGGRLLYTAWLPSGAIGEIAKRMRAATTDPAISSPRAAFVGAPAGDGPPPVLWHDPATFAHLVPGGADAITLHDGEAVFTAGSADEWFGQMERHHPMWIAAQQAIEPATWASIRAEGLEILAAETAPGGGIAIRSPYVVVEIHPASELPG